MVTVPVTVPPLSLKLVMPRTIEPLIVRVPALWVKAEAVLPGPGKFRVTPLAMVNALLLITLILFIVVEALIFTVRVELLILLEIKSSRWKESR